MSVIHTRREAQCVLGLLASGGAFSTAGALASAIGATQASILSSLHAVKARLESGRDPRAFIAHRHGFGWSLTGRGECLDEMYREAMRLIAYDAGTVAADIKAGTRLPALRATPSSMIGMGA